MSEEKSKEQFFIHHMEEIDLDKKMFAKAKWVVLFDEPVVYLVLAWLIIFGLETYYYNRNGNPGVLYISGFFSWVIGALLVQLLYRRIKRLKQTMHERSALMGGAIYRHVSINDEGLTIERERIDKTVHYWTGLSAFTMNKDGTGIKLIFGSVELGLSDKELGKDGVGKLNQFLIGRPLG